MGFISSKGFSFSQVDNLGTVTLKDHYIDDHIKEIIKLKYVDVVAIKKAKISVVIDAVNSSGGIVIPKLLEALNCNVISKLYCEPNGEFPHNPEPLPEHLKDLSNKVIEESADIGIVVDPDVDRLAFVCENGDVFGEEYTLVAVADHITSQNPGNSVSNLSSTKALGDVIRKNGGMHYSSAVGEVNVVEMMKDKNAIIGGEGNGGVILPDLHYGRDALVGIALFLTYYANKDLKMSELKKTFPQYTISKNKLALNSSVDIDSLLQKISKKYSAVNQNKIDGLKLEFNNEWVHMRKSNTEPIIRIYAESENEKSAHELGERFVEELKSLI